MRKIEFEVPAEIMADFTEKLAETGLDNRVLGKTEADEIEIEVYYDKSDAGLIDELEEYLQDLKTALEDDEDEEEEQDDED